MKHPPALALILHSLAIIVTGSHATDDEVCLLQKTLQTTRDLCPPRGKGKPTEWMTMAQAGWSSECMKKVTAEIQKEAGSTSFRKTLLQNIVKEGVSVPAGEILPRFVGVKDLDAYIEGNKALNPAVYSEPRVAVFILGPSASGKTTAAAFLMNDVERTEKWGLKFPVMNYDGADLREVSEIWKRDAQSPNGARLKDFFHMFNPPMKKMFAQKLPEWISKYRPNTVLIPDTATPCNMVAGCKIRTKIKQMKDLGYKIKFLAVHARYWKVKQRGSKRSLEEGKSYSTCSYAGAVDSVINTIRPEYPNPADWAFIDNNGDNGGPPKFVTWKHYRESATKSMNTANKDPENGYVACMNYYLYGYN